MPFQTMQLGLVFPGDGREVMNLSVVSVGFFIVG